MKLLIFFMMTQSIFSFPFKEKLEFSIKKGRDGHLYVRCKDGKEIVAFNKCSKKDGINTFSVKKNKEGDEITEITSIANDRKSGQSFFISDKNKKIILDAGTPLRKDHLVIHGPGKDTRFEGIENYKLFGGDREIVTFSSQLKERCEDKIHFLSKKVKKGVCSDALLFSNVKEKKNGYKCAVYYFTLKFFAENQGHGEDCRKFIDKSKPYKLDADAEISYGMKMEGKNLRRIQEVCLSIKNKTVPPFRPKNDSCSQLTQLMRTTLAKCRKTKKQFEQGLEDIVIELETDDDSDVQKFDELAKHIHDLSVKVNQVSTVKRLLINGVFPQILIIKMVHTLNAVKDIIKKIKMNVKN